MKRKHSIAWVGPARSPWMPGWDDAVSETIHVPVNSEAIPEVGVGGYFAPSGRTVGEQHPGARIVVDPAKGDTDAFLAHELQHARENAVIPPEVQAMYSKSPYAKEGQIKDFMDTVNYGVTNRNLPLGENTPWMQQIILKAEK